MEPSGHGRTLAWLAAGAVGLLALYLFLPSAGDGQHEPAAAPDVAIPTSPTATRPAERPPEEAIEGSRIVRSAPGPVEHARGLDLPPPELLDEPQEPDPGIQRYLENAERPVNAAAHIAYLSNTTAMLDDTIARLEGELEELDWNGEDDRAAVTRVRLERLRARRSEQQEELEWLRTLEPDTPIEPDEPTEGYENVPEAVSVPPPGVEPPPTEDW